MKPSQRTIETIKALHSPLVGDLFCEMYSFWVHVLKVEDDRIYVMESYGKKLPEGGKIVEFSRDDFVKHYSYNSIDGAWVKLVKRGVDVSGLYNNRQVWFNKR